MGLNLGFAVQVMFRLFLAASRVHAKAPSPVTCAQWLDQALRVVERVPMLRRRDRALDTLADSCEAMPGALRRAAASSRNHRGGDRGREIAAAARAVLGDECHVAGNADTGLDLQQSCPLFARKLELAPQQLRDMSADDYLALNAVVKGIVDAGAWDANAELFTRNLALSAALIGEAKRERGRAPR